MCSTLHRWRERGDRELPWLAGPLFTATTGTATESPRGADVTVVERFLVGGPTEPAHLEDALVALELEGLRPEPSLPPDSRGLLVEAVDHYASLLGDAYSAVSIEVQLGHRRTVDTLIEQWQPRLDEAAGEIDERVAVLVGSSRSAIAPPRRRVRDHAGLALAFVVIALGLAATVMWLVLQGWPMESVDFGI